MEMKAKEDEEQGRSSGGGAMVMGMAGMLAGEEMWGRCFKQLGGSMDSSFDSGRSNQALIRVGPIKHESIFFKIN